MKAMDAFELLSVRSRNRLLRKYHTLPEKIGDFEFYSDYLQHFEPYDFPMGHFEQESELKPLLQQLIAGSYLYDYHISVSKKGPELCVNIVTEYFVLKGPVSAFTRRELSQLTNHLLVEQFDKEAAVEEKKVSTNGLNKVREQRKALWEARLSETTVLCLIFAQKTSDLQDSFKPGKGDDVICGISDKMVPWIAWQYSNMRHLIETLFLSAIDLDAVANALKHLNSIDSDCDPGELFDQVIFEQGYLEECYQNEHYSFDSKSAIERLVGWEQRFGVLSNADVSNYIEQFRLKPHDYQEYKRLRERQLVYTPEKIKANLDRSVIGQVDAKRQMSLVMYLHLLRCGMQTVPQSNLIKTVHDNLQLELPRPNMVVTGPTGSGKTFILRLICDMFNLPFLTIDCASLTAAGYVGRGLSDHFRALLAKYDNKPEAIKHAVILFDEFDKISEKQINRDSVGGVEIQQEFLVLLEDKEYNFEESRRSEQMVSIRTDKMLFVFCGSFHGIEPFIAKRISSGNSKIGFRLNPEEAGSDGESGDLFQHITTDDLISFGIIPELAGRVNHIVSLSKLTRDDYISILKESDRSPLRGYENFFRLHHHRLVIREEVYGLIAGRAVAGATGARGLAPVVHKLLRNLMWFASGDTGQEYVIDEDFFHNAMKGN